jgi:hypothetical protein
MTSRNENYKKFLRSMGSGALVVLGILSALGSGGGGDTVATPSGATPSSVAAFNFNAGNTVTAARFAASAMSFFPKLSALEQKILAALAASDPGNSPFDLAMCANTGHSMLAWIDGDHSDDLSMGDSASLQFTNCDMDGNGASASGTVKFGITSVDPDPLPDSVSLNISVNLTITDAPDTKVLIANFGATSSTPDNTDFTDVYTAHDASGQKLAVTQNGSALFEFGCFSVTQTFSVADSAGTYTLSPSGVINASDSIMSLAGGPQLSFVSDRIESGTTRLLSLSAPGCATLGVAGGVGDSDGSYIDMVALGGGVRLHTFDAANTEINTTNTTWDALLK